MTVEVTAELARSAFYAGRVSTDDQKLDKKDFQQMVYAALGDMGRIEWYQEAQRGNQDFYWGKAITTDNFIVTKQKGKNIIEMDERGVMTVPRAAGIIRVYPTTCDGDEYTGDLDKIAPGGEGFFFSPKQQDDLGMKGYVPKGNTLDILGMNVGDSLSVDYIPFDLALDIPEGLAWVIIKEISSVVGPDQTKNVDNTEDGDPNTATYKGRLADPNTIQN